MADQHDVVEILGDDETRDILDMGREIDGLPKAGLALATTP
jgi:hypothetical protein